MQIQCKCIAQVQLSLAILALCVLGATAQPFQPGTGFVPLGKPLREVLCIEAHAFANAHAFSNARRCLSFEKPRVLRCLSEIKV